MESVPLLQDISYRSTLFAVTIRSPVPRGRLLSIEHPQLERSYTLITAQNIPGKNEVSGFPVPVLASGELSYLGEPVALLAGPDRAKLEAYRSQCRILFREEKPVFAAPASSALPGETGGKEGAGGEPPGEEPGIFEERSLDRGDLEGAFAGAASVLSGTYSTGIQEHGYSEATGALAEYISGPPPEGEGGIQRIFVIHTATQWPCHVSRSVAQVLGLEENQVITEPSDPGLPMDGKIWYPSLIACQAALAACLTRRNVRLLLNREEDFRFSPKRNASVVKIQSALGEKGEILGTRIDLSVDLGAQEAFGREILDQSCLGVLGIAAQGPLSLRARAVRTNIPPQGPFGGFGAAQGSFAMERHCSRIADSLGLDPAEWRKDNFPGKRDFLLPRGPGGTGSPEEAPLEQLLDTAAAMSDYYRKWGSYELLRRRRREEPRPPRPEALRGVGIALGRQGNGFLHLSETGFIVEATLNIDGSLEIRSSLQAGRDCVRIWSGIAREILGVEEDKVRVMSRNTALCPDSGPASLSRNISILSSLVERSCLAIRNQRFRDPLPITVREGAGGKEGDPKREPCLPIPVPNPGSQKNPGWAAAVVEVIIEPYSYTPVVKGVWLAVDGGRILSEKAARRGLKLAGIQALGWASGEYLEYQEGALTPPHFGAYGIPGPGEIPPIRVDFLWNDAAPKGVGELPFSCVPAAYIQAVSQAADHPFGKIPLLPAEVWEILEGGSGGREAGPEQGGL
jgi:CO/xanthine dehydrogenase Mo-binding subunit